MIYDGSLHDTTNISSAEYLTINSCNIRHSRGISYTVVRDAGRVDYHVLYVAGGECTCLYEGTEALMTRGQFVVYPPNKRQWYSFAAGKHTTTLWVHFSGSGVEKILSRLGIPAGVYRAPLAGEAEACFAKMVRDHAIGTEKHRVAAQGALLELLSLLAPEGERVGAVAYPEAVVKMVEYIHSDWQSELRVADIAGRVGLSESRAAHLFRAAVGKSIHKYITDLRISAAKEHLRNTSSSIAEISEMMGFADALYFSRAFKAAVGVSPRAFREQGE